MPGLGQIGLVRTKGFSSWLTRTITRSNWNHCILYTADGEVVSAESSGVQVMPAEYFPGAVWSNFDLTQTQILQIINFANAQLGKPYGQLTYLWIGVALVLRVKHTPDWILRRLASKRDWICSQLCDSSYQAAGIHLFEDERPTGCVWPGSFEPIFKARGWIKREAGMRTIAVYRTHGLANGYKYQVFADGPSRHSSTPHDDHPDFQDFLGAYRTKRQALNGARRWQAILNRRPVYDPPRLIRTL